MRHKHSLAFLTQHHHVMVEYSTLAQIVLGLGLPDENKVVPGIDFDAGNLRILTALINAKHVLIEDTPNKFIYLSDYFEAVCDEATQQQLLSISHEILRFDNPIHHYEYAMELATKLKGHFKQYNLGLRDCLDLVIASLSNTQFYISKKKETIEACIRSFDLDFIDFEGLKVHDIDSFVEFIKNDTPLLEVLANQELIHVYTREDRRIAIQRGSTPVDFAYKIHTALGHACHAARVTRYYGREDQYSFDCQLNFVLEDGDKVEIIKRPGESQRPDVAWCKFAVTDKAVEAIHSFLNKENVSRGNLLLKREFGDSYLNGNKFKYISHRLHCGSVEELQQRLGSGEIDIKIVREKEIHYSHFMMAKMKSAKSGLIGSLEDSAAQPAISGVESRFFQIARCCHPMPGDAIAGILCKRATYIHRHDCKGISHIGPEKKKPLSWNSDKCTAILKIRIKDRSDIMRCLLNRMAAHRVDVNLLSLSPAASLYPTSEPTSHANVCVLFESMIHLNSLIADIEDIQDIVQVTIRNISPGADVYKKPAAFIKV